MSKRRKKPTRRDLIALLTWAAHHAGTARNDHYDDRGVMSFERGQARLKEMEKRLHEAAGNFPYPDESEWCDEIDLSMYTPRSPGPP